MKHDLEKHSDSPEVLELYRERTATVAAVRGFVLLVRSRYNSRTWGSQGENSLFRLPQTRPLRRQILINAARVGGKPFNA